MKLINQNVKIKIFTALACASVLVISFTAKVFAATATDNAFSFLQSKQDNTGQITTGFSAPSQWSAIAFSANKNDISTIQTTATSSSLLDFLLTDAPQSPSSTSDWESRILAIVDAGYDPTKFGGVNYVSQMESLVSNSQIGGLCSLNDSIFGLMAEIAAGSTANSTIKQTTLDFILSQEDPTTGGFSYSLDSSCAYPSPASADITGAAAVALAHAKSSGMTSSRLDDAIASVSAYLATNTDSDGGYGYYGSSDTDSTGWVLQGLNALGLGNSQEATNAKAYLLSQQGADGGIQDFDYSSSQMVSNATTTAQALIGILGKDWILKTYDPATALHTTGNVTPTPTPTSVPANTPTPTPTPTPVLTSSSSSSSSGPTSVPTVVPTMQVSPIQHIVGVTQEDISPTPVIKDVLGTQSHTNYVAGAKNTFLPVVFMLLGSLFLLAGIGKIGYNYFLGK